MKTNNKKTQQLHRYIISGGGTGGHIFPAIAIANSLKKIDVGCEILFVGATGKMEMEKVPAAGYQIVGLPVAGFQRRLTLKNLSFPFKLLKSLRTAKKIIADFNPDVAIGVGGYASGPVLRMAGKLGIPTVLQEQNSYPGITNKILAKKAKKICVAYTNMERFFESSKLVFTGNPVRENVIKIEGKREKALMHFGLHEGKKVVLVIGGSLGARTINESIMTSVNKLSAQNIQVLWQTGKYYYDAILQNLKDSHSTVSITPHAFIMEMDLAYSAADVIVSRAGAISVSELCLVKKPVILVPSPNVAEDHQTKNAMALVNKSAAILVKDSEAQQKLYNEIVKLVQNKKLRSELSENIGLLAKQDSADSIAKEIIKIAAHA